MRTHTYCIFKQRGVPGTADYTITDRETLNPRNDHICHAKLTTYSNSYLLHREFDARGGRSHLIVGRKSKPGG